MDEDTERLLLAERAAEWLVRLETATPAERAEFQDWLALSPVHVREALAATATHLLLAHLLRSGRIDPKAFATQDDGAQAIGGGSHEPPAAAS